MAESADKSESGLTLDGVASPGRAGRYRAAQQQQAAAVSLGEQLGTFYQCTTVFCGAGTTMATAGGRGFWKKCGGRAKCSRAVPLLRGTLLGVACSNEGMSDVTPRSLLQSNSRKPELGFS